MTTPEQIQQTKTYNSLSSMRKEFVVKKNNRKMIDDGIAICRNIGFDTWSRSCGLTSWNVAIVEELLNN